MPACAWAAAGAEVPAPVAAVIAAQRLPPSAVSFAVVDPDSGRLVLGQNPDTPRSPASTIKVVTTFAALDLLGPAYTWHTRASIRGALDGGVLDGDLILQGGGDPYMTLERWWSFAQRVARQGTQDHSRRHRHRQHRVLPAAGGSRRIRRPAESRLQRAPGCTDGEFPIHRVPGACRTPMHGGSMSSPIRRRSISRSTTTCASPRGAAAAPPRRVDFKVASASWDRVVFSGALSAHCAERSFTRVLLQPATYAFGTFVELWHELGGEFSGQAARRGRTRGRPGAAQLRLLDASARSCA